jgi:hypothetical protein
MINLVDINYLDKIINKEVDRKEHFISFDDNHWIAVDNTTGDAWTETFESPVLATQWLVDKRLNAEYLRQHYRIKKAFKRDILVNI